MISYTIKQAHFLHSLSVKQLWCYPVNNALKLFHTLRNTDPDTGLLIAATNPLSNKYTLINVILKLPILPHPTGAARFAFTQVTQTSDTIVMAFVNNEECTELAEKFKSNTAAVFFFHLMC